jgi:hypothetical protein
MVERVAQLELESEIEESASTASLAVRVALGALSLRLPNDGHPLAPEARFLAGNVCGPAEVERLRSFCEGELSPEHPLDCALTSLAHALSLTLAELLAVALACEVEREPLLGRALSWLQEPVASARPTLGLLATAFASAGIACSVDELASGRALATGLLTLIEGAAPLPERAISVPLHLFHALHGRLVQLPTAAPGLSTLERIPLPRSLLHAAQRHAQGVRSGGTVVVRSAARVEGRAVAAAIAQALGREPLFLVRESVPGLAPWLQLGGLIPVFSPELGPGERFRVPPLDGYHGAVVVALGLEGAVESGRGTALSFPVPIPDVLERTQLWGRALGDSAIASLLAQTHRHGAGRIAELGRLARQHAAMEQRDTPTLRDVHAASWHGDGGLETLAHPIRDAVDDDCLVLTAPLRSELALLVARCKLRECLARELGTAAATRYRSGVRALFVGPSGTGKTLAVSWLATKLALPLYRVDLASVVSKYIGETEKNLADLLARAESAEVVLFFDEADSLFGKRTDVQHSNDRFANAQTNYLLQRIESYDGIVVLASNSRSRFDPAFSRRLDQILEFPLPGPEERRALWTAHLGASHTLSERDLNALAIACDLAGGHVRNVVLAAAVLASEARRALAWDDVLLGLTLEYRKVGKPLPASLTRKVAP